MGQFVSTNRGLIGWSGSMWGDKNTTWTANWWTFTGNEQQQSWGGYWDHSFKAGNIGSSRGVVFREEIQFDNAAETLKSFTVHFPIEDATTGMSIKVKVTATDPTQTASSPDMTATGIDKVVTITKTSSRMQTASFSGLSYRLGNMSSVASSSNSRYLYIIVKSDTESTSAQLYIDYNSKTYLPYNDAATIESMSTVSVGQGGAWVPCQCYYPVNGVWTLVQVFYGQSGQWKEISTS